MSLASLIDEAGLVVCLGPGGVGKTTLSAVLALRQAAIGRRTLVLTIDPARRLADALGLSGLTNEPAPVTSYPHLTKAGSLSALMLDPAATFDHLIGLLVPNALRRRAMLANRFYQHMSRSLAGMLEYMAVERLHALVATREFDSVVLDTPPTSNAIDFLEAPERLGTFFSAKVTRWFMPAAKASGGGLASRLLGQAGASAMALLGRVAGGDFVEETREFFGTFADLLSGFQTRGLEVSRLLRDPATVFLVVTTADEQRLAEAQTLDRRLREAGVEAKAFLVNRVDEPFLPAADEAPLAIERATELLGGDRDRVQVFLERLESLRRAHADQALDQARAVAALERYAGSRPVVTAPRVPPGESPRAALLALYVGLFADAPGHAELHRAAAASLPGKSSFAAGVVDA